MISVSAGTGRLGRLMAVLGVAAAVGCQDTSTPSEPAADTGGALHAQAQTQSGGDLVFWQNNELELQYAGNTYRIVIDQAMVSQASFYVNGSLEFTAQIYRQNGTISGARIVAGPGLVSAAGLSSLASGDDWFEGNDEGEVTNTSIGPVGAGCDPGDPDCPILEFVTPASFVLGPCDSFRWGFMGAAATVFIGAGTAVGQD